MAARFWVAGGTGLWSSTTNWSATSGGASGASVPGSADTVTFNASSGSGTATVDSSVTIQTLTMPGFTGTLAYGTNSISVNSTGTVFTGDSTYSVTGTPVINVTSAGSTAITVATGTTTEANSVSFNFTGGTYTLTFLSSAALGNYAKNVNFTGFAGTWGTRSSQVYFYGSVTFSTGMTINAATNAHNFVATSGTQVLTTNGKTLDFPIQINGAGGTTQLADALTMGATRTFAIYQGTFDGNNKTISGTSGAVNLIGSGNTIFIKNISTALLGTHNGPNVTLVGNCSFGAYTHTAGNLDLGSYTLTTPIFDTSNATNTRTLNFNTGSITCTGTGTVWNINYTVLTISGTPVVNISNSGATAIAVTVNAATEDQALSYNITSGTYVLTLTGRVKNLNFTGFSGSWPKGATTRVYGSLTLSSSMTLGASTTSLVFQPTTMTQIITSNGKTIDCPVEFSGTGTSTLADALTVGSTRALTLYTGMLDGNNKTISGAASFSLLGGGSASVKNISTAIAFSHANGNLTQAGANAFGAYTLTSGTLDLAGYTLTTPSFTTATGTKSLTFNGGTLTVTNATTTAFNNAVPTGFSTTAGTGDGKISMTAATAKTFVGGGSTYNCTLSNDGAGALTISGSNTFTTVANGVQPTAFTFTSSTTTTLTNWNVSGTSGNLVTIISSTAGTAATLSKSSGTVSANYLSLKDSTATGGATWYAGANSTNVSGNTGWLFASAPSAPSAAFFFLF